ncbi:hypothetical protein F5Y18DRAFT_427149 [Xylariaceae sp. FL1019]|nr:hypothetical protein F5Y18DRAFT_427149 [Xylariaceae sp. FL1019]
MASTSMAEMPEVPDQYYTLEGRLASFNTPQPATRRGSNAKGKGKAVKAVAWPHNQLDPERFAKAGFYLDPTPEDPDSTVCFHCHNRFAGWEEGDDPCIEHLRLFPDCGFAIIASITLQVGNWGSQNACLPELVSARKRTFAGRWPHERKRGWKCKSKQMVDAGFSYTPTMESDDWVTCSYCDLGLDGWEPKDNPTEEHFRREPACRFFTDREEFNKIKARGKSARASVQSVATVASDMTSLLEQPVDNDDSVLTTTSVMTQGGTKRARAKKGATTKGKKGRTKKEEPVEVLEDPPEITAAEPELTTPELEEVASQSKLPRGRKRTSTDIEDPGDVAADAPAPKKRATRGRAASTKVDSKKTKAKAPIEPSPEPEPLPVPDQIVDSENIDELAEGHDMSIMSNATVVRTSLSTSTTASKKRGRPSKQSIPAVTKPAPSPSQSHIPAVSKPTTSPSQSPQTSDAENQPPSSRPSDSAQSTRVALAPVAATPSRSRTSPSKRNVIAGLGTTDPWTSVDVDLLLDDMEQENLPSAGRFLKTGMELSDAEKQMTAEAWLYHNAEQAEKRLRFEAEAVVTAFEKEGARAMRALEGIVLE